MPPPAWVQAELAAREHGEAVPIATGKTKHRERLYVRLKAACQRAGVEVFTLHALRRLADDQLYEDQVDPSTSGAVLGHSPEVAMRSYRKVRIAAKYGAMLAAGLGQITVPLASENVVSFPGALRAEQLLATISTEDLLSELGRRQKAECQQQSVNRALGDASDD